MCSGEATAPLLVSLLVAGGAGVTEQHSSPNEIFTDGGEGGSGQRGSRSERPRGSVFLTFKLKNFAELGFLWVGDDGASVTPGGGRWMVAWEQRVAVRGSWRISFLYLKPLLSLFFPPSGVLHVFCSLYKIIVLTKSLTGGKNQVQIL